MNHLIEDDTLNTENNLHWVEKYRPHTFEQVYSNSSIFSICKKFTETKSIPHLLFYGPPGSGKTTTALIIAKMLHGDHYTSNTIDLNASDERGINVVRNTINHFSQTKNIFNDNPKIGK